MSLVIRNAAGPDSEGCRQADHAQVGLIDSCHPYASHRPIAKRRWPQF
jgi:hypothetical protein